MSDLNQARRRFKVRIAKKQDTSDATAALLGLGDGTVLVPNQPGQVYIRVGNQENYGTAYNDRSPNTDNLPVFVGYDPITDPERRIFQVLSVRQSAYVGAGYSVTPSVGAHAPTHQFGGGDDVYIQWRRLMGLRVGRPVLFIVTVDPGYIYRGTSWIAAPVGATTVDLTAQHAALVGTQAQYVLISLTSTGAISVLPAGTIKSSPANLLISDIPTPPAGNLPLAAIRLYKTQTYIGDSPAEPDIIDLRFPTYDSMNSGGSAWKILGNIATNPAINFLGTTDAQPIILRTNSLEVGYIGVSTAIAGNARGAGAIELMTERDVATQVASGAAATSVGGSKNTASASGATNVGGSSNVVSGIPATNVGGSGNTVSGAVATNVGGLINVVSGNNAATVGGWLNTADAANSFAAGTRAKTNAKDGAFVWSDYNSGFNFSASANNEFAARATGGIRFVTAIDGAGAATYQATVGTTAIITAKKIGAAGIALDPNAATGDFALSLSPANLTANRRVTFPDADLTFSNGGTLALGGFTATIPATGTVALGTGTATRLAVWSDANTLAAGTVVQPAANVLTLTNAAASTLALAITAAKTLTLTAADDYNLTIPGTGTLALETTGTVTVTLTCGTSGTITLKATHQTLAWTKVGRKVSVTGYIKVDSVASPVGALILNGLQHTCVNGNAYYAASGTYGNLLAATATTSIVSFVVPNTTTMQIYKYIAGSVAVLAGDVQANSEFVIGATYFTT